MPQWKPLAAMFQTLNGIGSAKGRKYAFCCHAPCHALLAEPQHGIHPPCKAADGLNGCNVNMRIMSSVPYVMIMLLRTSIG